MNKLMWRWAGEMLERAQSEIGSDDGAYIMAIDVKKCYACGHMLTSRNSRTGERDKYNFGVCQLASLDISFVVFTGEMWRKSRDARVIVSFWADGAKCDETRLTPPDNLDDYSALDRLWTELFASHRLDVWRDCEIALSA